MDSILQDEKRCYVCGCYTNLQCHHIFGGTANRRKSEQHGLKIWLCFNHHVGKDGVHRHQDMMDAFHMKGQKAFEKTHTRKEFIKEFGRSYL